MTTPTFKPARPSDFREGDTARITKGDAVVVAPIRHSQGYGLYVDVPGLSIAVDAIELDEMGTGDGITLERAEPQLPTTPGFYQGRDWSSDSATLAYHLNDRGQWSIIWSTGDSAPREPRDPDLPLIRLTKETSA